MSHVYYLLCLGLGRLLRAGTYSRVRIVREGDRVQARKRRSFYAPLLVWLGEPIVRVLDTGSRVLRQREWERREQTLYERLYGAAVRVDVDGTLVLPYLPGSTLAALLDDETLGDEARARAIRLAVTALAELHARGITHADAMAENVLVDLDAGVARWFDFETVHDANRSLRWRRADDVRAVLATCLLRTGSEMVGETLTQIVDTYDDESVVDLLAAAFASVWHRPLSFHLGQAPLPFARFREIGRALAARVSR